MTPRPTLRRRRLLGTLPAAAALLAAPAWAQSGRPITVVVPQPAGSPSDAYARKVQPVMQRHLGQPLVIENLPGAGGSIGLQKVLSAPADGQWLAMVSQTEPILTPLAMSGVRYRPEQLRMVGTTGNTVYALAGRPDLKAAHHAELVALGKEAAARPWAYAHIGHGSMIHLLGEHWSRTLGVPLVHVPYKGVPPLVQDLMGGQVDLAFLPLSSSTLTLFETGKLKLYGTTAPQPVPSLPQAQPLPAADPLLRGFVYHAWGALVLSRSVPQERVERLHQAFAAAMQEPEVLAYVRASGTVPPASPPSLAELDRFYQRETQQYQQLARSIGLVAL